MRAKRKAGLQLNFLWVLRRVSETLRVGNALTFNKEAKQEALLPCRMQSETFVEPFVPVWVFQETKRFVLFLNCCFFYSQPD